MAVPKTESIEKSPTEEKVSYDLNEVAVPAASVSRDANEPPTKRNLPYGWQLLMIILTCLCTCEQLDIFSSVTLAD